MTFEVLQVFVVVYGGISYGIVLFRRSIDNGCVLVGEAWEIDPIFLRIKRLYKPNFLRLIQVMRVSDSPASLAVIQPKALILGTHYNLIASVIKGNSCDTSRPRTWGSLRTAL